MPAGVFDVGELGCRAGDCGGVGVGGVSPAGSVVGGDAVLGWRVVVRRADDFGLGVAA